MEEKWKEDIEQKDQLLASLEKQRDSERQRILELEKDVEVLGNEKKASR